MIDLSNLIFPYDYVILIIILLVLIFSFWKGLIHSIMGLLTWVGSIFITIYTYNSLGNFLTSRILEIKFFENYDYFVSIISMGISIPILFLISLFILKKIRKLLSEDLNKKIIGIMIDKFFGLIYGICFSYVVITTIHVCLDRYNYNDINLYLQENSYIVSNINKFNVKYIYVNEEVKIID